MKQKNGKNWEALITKAVENVKNGVIITDPNQEDNPIIYVNKGFEAMTGYKKEEVIGKNCRFMQGNDRDQPEIDIIRKAIKQRKEVYIVLKNYKKNNEMFWNELYITPVFDDKGKITHFIGIQNDVTAKKQVEEQKKEYKEYLEKLVEERTKKLQDANQAMRREVEERRKAQQELNILYEEISESNKKLKNKLERASEERIRLTEKEKTVFQAITENPERTSKETARNTSLAVSTVNTIKNRLNQEGYYKKKYLPSPYLEELSMITIIYYESKIVEESQKEENTRIRIINETAEAVFAASNENTGIIILLNKNWETSQETAQRLLKQANINEKTYKNLKTTHLKTSNSKINKYFDYAEYLRRRLEIEKTPTTLENGSFTEKIGETQRRILYGLSKEPELTIKELSQKIQVSEPSIINHKKQMMDKQIIPRIIPDLKKTNGQIIVLEHHILTDNNINNNPEQEIIDIESQTEHVSLSVYKEYRELREAADLCEYSKNPNLVSEKSVKIQVDTLNNLKIDFSAAIKKAMLIK